MTATARLRTLLPLAFDTAMVPLFVYAQLRAAVWVWQLKGADLAGYEGAAFSIFHLPIAWLSVIVAAIIAVLVARLMRLSTAEALLVGFVLPAAATLLVVGATAIAFALS